MDRKTSLLYDFLNEGENKEDNYIKWEDEDNMFLWQVLCDTEYEDASSMKWNMFKVLQEELNG